MQPLVRFVGLVGLVVACCAGDRDAGDDTSEEAKTTTKAPPVLQGSRGRIGNNLHPTLCSNTIRTGYVSDCVFVRQICIRTKRIRRRIRR